MGMNALAKSQNKSVVNLDTLDEKGRISFAVAWDALSENTKTAYQEGIKRLTDRGVVVKDLTDEVFAMVISRLDTEGLSPATLSLTVAAVKWCFKHIYIDAVKWTTTDKRLITIKRDTENRGNGQVDGLSWSDVDFVCRFAEQEQSVKGYRDSALIRLMSDCLLRISEAVAVNVEDLQGNALVVHSSKTDQEGKGEALYVGDRTREMIRLYCDKASIPPFDSPRKQGEGGSVKTVETDADGWAELSKEQRDQAKQLFDRYGTEEGLRRLRESDPEMARQFEIDREAPSSDGYSDDPPPDDSR